MSEPFVDTLAEIHAREWGRLVAILARETRDLDAAEDLAQEAFTRAVTVWGTQGVPETPGAWLTTTARNALRDDARRRATLERKLPLLVVPDERDDATDLADAAFGDDRLRLIFTCCHPALAPESRPALTLRLVCGLTTREIAALFLTTEPTMQARITRAKAKIATAGIPYRVPAITELPDRLSDVLAVIHLVYTGGHTAGEGERVRAPRHVELAMRLARIMHELLPREPEATGLLALIILTEARQATRVDADGLPARLEDMDRSQWDRKAIASGIALTERALRATSAGAPGPYTLQAAIAAIHAESPTFAETDWPQIVAFYTLLGRIAPSPVVDLARAVAIGMAEGPEAGLLLIEPLRQDDRLARYDVLHAARADLLRRADREIEARAAWRQAAASTANGALQTWYARMASG